MNVFNELTQEEDHEHETLLYDVSKRQSLQTLSNTRWLSRVDSISTLNVNYDKIIIRCATTSQSAHDAIRYMHAMQRFETIVVAVLTQYTLRRILGKKNIEFLHNIRNEDMFDKLYNRIVSIGASIEVVASKLRTVGRQRHRANSSSDKASVQDHYRLNYYFPFLDHMKFTHEDTIPF
ncbi:hypothetical protein MAR_005458 [Mya arenaria]|uniref:Uncharacterized protein n=1 Tax=Mya arenaria TaxID=6604 RepID=A0ABY7F3R6_MYAAR|nr:hypothetical protein MAR_005458 [Mya arenaria]